MTIFESITDRPSCRFDQASAETDRTTALAIAAKRLEMAQAGESAYECADCGCELTEERREAYRGCKVCVPCGDIAEAKARGYRRV